MLDQIICLEPAAVKNAFRDLYGKEPRVFSAPGRVNLIGEHTDYNDGFVLPLAADRRTNVAAAARTDTLVRVYSFNLQKSEEFDLDREPASTFYRGWGAYVEGIARVLHERGYLRHGADLGISSDIPMGAGLSSSAALETAVGLALLRLANIDIDPLELAQAAQTAEHRFGGTNSGLMDQMTTIFGAKDFALLIDCRTNDRRLIPLNMPATEIVVCDTGVKHHLATTAYNQRRRECEQAVTLLRAHDSAIRSLRDVAVARLEEYAEYLPPTLFRRMRHVVSENERTLAAADALATGDTALLGKLMNSSHESLRDDYEVSCRELDIMVQLARDQPGVAGARMMGGGFGGSTVNLVSRERNDDFRARVSAAYQRITGIKPTIFTVNAAEGVSEIAA